MQHTAHSMDASCQSRLGAWDHEKYTGDSKHWVSLGDEGVEEESAGSDKCYAAHTPASGKRPSMDLESH